ncbi:hypothetical protein SDC9_144833 [bioreactor metagenome]|uniref:Uncharacterized protein n=1 Tax=bioreactor metagenome TaxID=1076179 RepID=A0A645E7T5_9ZZZZ
MSGPVQGQSGNLLRIDAAFFNKGAGIVQERGVRVFRILLRPAHMGEKGGVFFRCGCDDHTIFTQKGGFRGTAPEIDAHEIAHTHSSTLGNDACDTTIVLYNIVLRPAFACKHDKKVAKLHAVRSLRFQRGITAGRLCDQSGDAGAHRVFPSPLGQHGRKIGRIAGEKSAAAAFGKFAVEEHFLDLDAHCGQNPSAGLSLVHVPGKSSRVMEGDDHGVSHLCRPQFSALDKLREISCGSENISPGGNVPGGIFMLHDARVDGVEHHDRFGPGGVDFGGERFAETAYLLNKADQIA